MINLLGRDGRHALRALAGAESLLAFDFDGTLAPLVDDRRRAALRPRTRTLLGRVCSLYPCAVISGRARADVARRLVGTGVRYVIGNHGLEGVADAQVIDREVRRAHGELARTFRGLQGVDIEEKQVTLAVHYRHAKDRRVALARIRQVLGEGFPSLRVVGGHHVVNVLPVGEDDKGTALMRLWDLVGASTALYVGDDLADEHAFRIATKRPLVAVRVRAGARTFAPSSAAFFLREQGEIDVLLAKLVDLRDGRS